MEDKKGGPRKLGSTHKGTKEREGWETNLVKLLVKSWAHLEVTRGCNPHIKDSEN